ncbi:MAG: hypothetical protein ABIU29_07170 [Chthoniobacterales bacterium]
MIKRTLPAMAAIFALSFSVSAQELASFTLARASASAMVEGRAALGEAGSFRTLNNFWNGNGPLSLVDGRLFSFPRAFGWVESTRGDFLPAFALQEVPRGIPAASPDRSTSGEKVNLFRKPDYVGGEVGVFYGRSIGGKYSREVESGYILGEIIEGNTRIQVGASYGHSTGNTPRIIGR